MRAFSPSTLHLGFSDILLGLIWGLTGGLTWSLDNISTVNAFDFSFLYGIRRIKIDFKNLITGLSSGLVTGLIYSLVSTSPLQGLVLGLLWGLIAGPIAGLVGGLAEAFEADIQINIRPNQGIVLSTKNSLFLLFIAFLLALAIRFLVWNFVVIIFVDEMLAFSIVAVTMTALIWFSLIEGGGDAVQKHLALRITLYLNGSISWDYARFLNYCTDRLLLQRVGGRYRFIHKLLQEHFANMPLEK